MKKPKKKPKKTPLKTPPKETSNIIQNCVFAGVHFDAKAVEVLQVVAEGLKENAMALCANADAFSDILETFKGQNVTLAAPMLQVGSTTSERKSLR